MSMRTTRHFAGLRFRVAALFLVLMTAFAASGAIASAASTYTVLDNATGGDCASIGSWDGAGKTCTLTGDVSGHIVVASNGVTLDGGGYSLTGPGAGAGVRLESRSIVTVRNLQVTGFANGVHLVSTLNTTVESNTLTGNTIGIFLRRLHRDGRCRQRRLDFLYRDGALFGARLRRHRHGHDRRPRGGKSNDIGQFAGGRCCGHRIPGYCGQYRN